MRRDGQAMVNRSFLISLQASRSVVGVLMKMLKRGEGTPPGSLKSTSSALTDSTMAAMASRASCLQARPWKSGSSFWRMSIIRVIGAAVDHAPSTAFRTAFSSGDVKPLRQRVRVGMVSVSKGKASNVTSAEDQILCFSMAAVVSWETSWTRKVMSGWIVGTGGAVGGAILTSVSAKPLVLAISWMATLTNPLRVACRVRALLPS